MAAWRDRIPLLAHTIPMNNCSQAPLVDATEEAARAFLESWNDRGMDWDVWIGEVEGARAIFAALIGASPDEVAVTTSVSLATAGLASALDFGGRRRKVVVTEAEFPTVGHVWLAHRKHGAVVEWVPVRDGVVHLEDYERVVDAETRLVSATHAYYLTGFKQDLEALVRLAHQRGALVYVDAYQTLGTCPVNVHELEVDFLASGTQKYLMGTPGIAFLYVRRDLLDTLQPSVTGWFGRTAPFSFDVRTLDWADSARRFDTGTPPVMNAYVARAALEIILEVGPRRIREWTETLSRRLIDGGTARGLRLLGTSDPTRKAPTTAFLCPDSHKVESILRARGILPSARGPVIRLAPHFFTTLEDVDTALDALVEVLETGTAAPVSPGAPGA